MMVQSAVNPVLHKSSRLIVDSRADRMDRLEHLLAEVRSWFSPYDSSTKSCIFCSSEIGNHAPDCKFPKWEDEVLRLIGP